MSEVDNALAHVPDGIEVYKDTPQGELRMHCFGLEASARRRAGLVFFFGGGWQGGTPAQFYPQARYLAERGMFAACAEYRVAARHGTPPSAALRDACSAMRWLRQQAGRFQLDPGRLAAAGGSAGGHLAAAAALCEGFDEVEDAAISCRPDALVLFNPVLDNSPAGYGNERVDVPWQQFSPLHNISAHCPPSLIFLGDADQLVPVATCESFRDRAAALVARCELCLTAGAGHGFFNFGCGDGQAYRTTVSRMDVFLRELGWLKLEN